MYICFDVSLISTLYLAYLQPTSMNSRSNWNFLKKYCTDKKHKSVNGGQKKGVAVFQSDYPSQLRLKRFAPIMCDTFFSLAQWLRYLFIARLNHLYYAYNLIILGHYWFIYAVLNWTNEIAYNRFELLQRLMFLWSLQKTLD